MKLLVLILFSTVSITASADTGVTGAEHLKDWSGTYEVIQCVDCPDIQTDHTNLKHFSSFDVYSFPISAAEKLECAVTDFYLSWGPNFKNPDGSSEGIGNTSGQCDWGFDEFLEVTTDSYQYRSAGHGSAGEISTVTLTKQSYGTYLLDFKVERKTPAWGFPLSYVLKAIVRKNP